ncbi:hypothetical protein E2562_018640 [Oryza meyeriana var. granulata]|uniref:Uncharacterized protein n=1 Tax=Oryza meyeriana var. granulata TaxID=110450 RepID=A0A6G1BYK2_9ORYZ|nr:hypothetical protein E2562_018640 [Oryza meyeriana var. granulata]
MPKPNHRAPSGAAASAVAGGPIDADWKYFLDNVREVRGSYGVHTPADGASPSYFLQYEKPLDGNRRPNNGGASTSSPRGAGRKRCRVQEVAEEEEETSSGEPALYGVDSNIEEDYRVFFEHIRVIGNDDFVLERGGKVIRYGGNVVDDEGSSSEASVMEKEGAVISSDESSDDSVISAPEPKPLDPRAPRQKVKSMADNAREARNVRNVEEDGTKEDLRTRERKNGKKVVAVPGRGKDGAMAAEEDQKNKLKKEVAFPSKAKGSTMAAKNLKDKKKAGKEEVVVPANGKDGPITEVKVIKVEDEEEDEQLQIVPAVEKLGATTSLANSSDCHETEPHIASGLHGVIWPTHINDRAESDFKQRLIHVLSKPFSQGEYDKLFGMATIRNPLTKERRTRCGVKYYYSQYEKGKSYFDCYPDLAKQVKEASYPNRLALLRGLFFWLENIGQEDQFRPWRHGHKHYKIMSF